MRVAINMTGHSVTDGEDGRASALATSSQYLWQAARSLRDLDADAEVMVLTDQHTPPWFSGWDRIEVPQASLPARWLGRQSAPIDAVLRRHEIDVVVSPFAGSAQTSVPQVLVATDLASLEDSTPGRTIMRREGTAGQAFLAASQFVRRKLLDLAGVPLNKSLVGAPGTSAKLDAPAPPLVQPPFLMLAIDPITVRHVPTVIEVIRAHADEFPQQLVIVGASIGNEPEWDGGVLRIEECDDGHLAGLYTNATAFVYPAHRDGSGMRVLEALRGGAVALAVNTGGIAEHGGDIPIYFTPGGSSSLVQGLRRVLRLDEAQRERRVTHGKRLARQFSWEATAWKLFSSFRKAITGE